MAYTKLFKVCQDAPLGYQSVNQAVDNNTALKDLYDAKHSLGMGGNNIHGVPLLNVGRHDDILIARTVAHFVVDSSTSTTTLTTTMSGPIFGSALQYRRIGTGRWQIYISTPQRFGATALCRSTASTDRKATCYASYSNSEGPSVYVTTWTIGAGWGYADLDFSLTIWTQRAA